MKLSLINSLVALLLFMASPVSADVWIADQGDGTYKNPVLFADYSDPDVVRVGDDFYMTSSSFNCLPGLPILHSCDLVSWKIIGHAVERLPEAFDEVQHGNGIWAPSFRYHDGYFWIVVGDPDRGIYMTRSKDPAGAWEPLHLMKAGKGLIDPCPLWDDDGKAYLVHAFAKSRAGKNSILVAQEMSPDAREVIGEERLVVDGRNEVHPTIEGPKFYKRNGWYYIFAPAGGVEFGWQTVSRSKQVFGPYETRRVLEQGSTDINGPHQGAWVELQNGEDWFVHFQELGAYGRLVHLNPMRWENGWPVMGKDFDGNGVGEPVEEYRKPDTQSSCAVKFPQTSDEFSGYRLSRQWQWHGNWEEDWYSLEQRPGWLRLHAMDFSRKDLTEVPAQLLQKFPAPSFTVTTKLHLPEDVEDLRTGLVVMGLSYAGMLVSAEDGQLCLEQITGKQEKANKKDPVHASIDRLDSPLWLRVHVEEGGICTFSFSQNGDAFTALNEPFQAEQGKWIGAKVGLIALGNDSHADYDWFRVE